MFYTATQTLFFPLQLQLPQFAQPLLSVINEQLSQDGKGETEASEQPEFFPFDHSQPFVLWQKLLTRMSLQGSGFVG